MRQTMKRFTKLAAGYSSVTLLGPVVTILLVPLCTRLLEPTGYGGRMYRSWTPHHKEIITPYEM